MFCRGFLLVIYSCLIISCVANDDADDPQECPGGFCVAKELCPNGIYVETKAQTSGVIGLRFSDVCREKEVCCKNDQNVRVNMMNSNYEISMEYGCGVHNPDGIGNQVEVNHTYAKYGEFPWVVVILQNDAILGGGTLIHPRFVLTAAHILELKDSKNLVASFGEWNLKQKESILPKQNIQIQNTIEHPEYEHEGLKNDIALAHLKQDVLYDRHIRQICLPNPTDVFDNQLCISTGWGVDPISLASSSYILKRVELPVIPRKKCKRMFAATRLGDFFRLHKSCLCAGAVEGVDMCYGDGGSGLFCPTESGSYVLAGIVSWGLSCGQQDVPGAYANVANFVTWINSTIAENV